jgi:hypothetical protein
MDFSNYYYQLLDLYVFMFIFRVMKGFFSVRIFCFKKQQETQRFIKVSLEPRKLLRSMADDQH